MTPTLTDRCALDMIKRARMRVLLRPPGSPCAVFFGSLLLGLALVEDESVGTMATDGRCLYYSPCFVETRLQDERELKAVLIHEVLHCANRHFARQAGRDLGLWNVATDLACNPIVRSNETLGDWRLPMGLLVPGEGMFRGWPSGLHAEAYYAMLLADGPTAKEAACSEGAGIGKVMPPRERADPGKDTADTERWKTALAGAVAKAASRGELPGDIRRMVEHALAGNADWRRILAEFVSEQRDASLSWSRPHRRHISSGLYLPGPSPEDAAGAFAVLVDTSGSIDDRQLTLFAGEIQGIAEATGSLVEIVYHDTEVRRVQEWKALDGPLVLESKGGGGTSHIPAFRWLEGRNADRESPFEAVICLTDMESVFPAVVPTLPVLWCVYGNKRPRIPFGRAAYIEGAS